MESFPTYNRSRAVAYGRSAAALPYLRRVYALFAGGVGFAIAGAFVALYAGVPVDAAPLGAVPPIVAFGIEHWFVMFVMYLGAFFAASAARRVPLLNVGVLFGYTFVTGIFIAPSLFLAQLMATHGASLDPSPIRDAFLLTGAAFTGLSGYALFTKKDFSFLGAALTTGIWVVLGASLLGIFFHSEVFQLAIASAGVLLFAGYILFDTSRILRDPREDDAVGAALRLFLDVVNMFLFLLRILSSSRER